MNTMSSQIRKKSFFMTLLAAVSLLTGCKDDISMYYNINIDKGLEVYSHVLEENDYEYGFMPGTNMRKKAEDINKLVYINLDKARDVIKSYGDKITSNNVEIIIVPNPCTDDDLYKTHDEEYTNNVNLIKKALFDDLY